MPAVRDHPLLARAAAAAAACRASSRSRRPRRPIWPARFARPRPSPSRAVTPSVGRSAPGPSVAFSPRDTGSPAPRAAPRCARSTGMPAPSWSSMTMPTLLLLLAVVVILAVAVPKRLRFRRHRPALLLIPAPLPIWPRKTDIRTAPTRVLRHVAVRNPSRFAALRIPPRAEITSPARRWFRMAAPVLLPYLPTMPLLLAPLPPRHRS
mmetsp:Transcript_22523/g.64786  ORF Transcript_22523/g.64786 Transcript_22523/m.64786 type:complete len:208 (+) Transcript_22523:680-1303(+)